MKRFSIIMLVIVLIIVAVSLLLRTCDQGTGEPSVNEAQYSIKADNRIYYTNDYSQGIDRFGDYITLNKYWTLKGENWEYHANSFYMSYKGYKSIEIIKR
jgi:hypothetical protein